MPPPKWEGVFKAIDEMYQCPQNSPMGVIGNEDCLKMNIYVPTMAKEPLPVMVYIHGGAFVLGHGGKTLIGPDFIVKQDVILVSFNYRLGALGFLCLGIKEAPGNAGLKDQLAALRWIKRNIAAFGGDPTNVTIFGTSAGGTSVSLLVASEAANGLFKRAIIHSGSALANWAVNIDPILVASKSANLSGYNTKDPKELYEIFSNMPYKDLVSIAARIRIGQRLQSNLLYLPCVEKKIPGVESVLNNLPYNLLAINPKNISLIYSSTNKEGLFFADEETDDSLQLSNTRNLFGDDLVFKSKEEEREIAHKVKEYYFGNENISMKTIMNVSELYGHLYFEMPVILEAEMMVRLMDAPVFNYYFTYSGGRNVVKRSTRFHNESGACHGDDIFYIFKGTMWPFRISKKDQTVIDCITKLITNFAKYGDPTPNSVKNLPVNWQPHSKDELKFLEIGEELKMISLPHPEVYEFWKDIYKRYRRTKVVW